ncbi:hypothetical protein U5801_08290 [Lamprobacter modestohalophilus]|uniref:hypothetical protein n=1 Tax=Lamprobacter modestohalophilus TaxID=1064514 RepID=UPI002ADEB89B|nr:hypothetical protein [Lamprobacter modestohalophilus]MEA1049805.1 hypothetical protein [Lamprobacter modestohalophilus]
MRFYSAVNVKEGYFDHEDSFKFISASEHREIHRRCPVRAGDVLLRKVGVGPRWSCVVPEGLDEFSIFVSVAMIRPSDTLNPEYLSTFMNCRYGQLQLLRLNKGISQPDLHLEDITELLVPTLTSGDQIEISNLVRDSQNLRDQSRALYVAAQGLLESELGLDKLTFQKPIGYSARFSTVSWSETFSAGRVDAQCFAPDALFYESWLHTHAQCDHLGKLLCSTAKGRQQADSACGATDYCSIKHINAREIVDASNCFPKADTPMAGLDDLLLAITGATIGKVGIVKRYERLAFSGDLLCLRTSESVDPHYLLLVLDHKIGQVQFNRWITGSTNGHLAPRDAARVLVPRLSNETEAQIAELVKSSLSKRKESEQLLEQAKSRIEQLIEEAARI